LPIERVPIQPREHCLANGFVPETAGVGRRHNPAQSVIKLIESGANRSFRAGKPRDLDEFRGRKVGLRNQQVCDDGIVCWKFCCSLRGGKFEAARVIERITRQRKKPAVPHQIRIKRGVRDSGRTTLIARSGTMRANQ
jgi:hypothetical protein